MVKTGFFRGATRGAPCTLRGAFVRVNNRGVVLVRRNRSFGNMYKTGGQGWQLSSNFKCVCGWRFVRHCRKFWRAGDLPEAKAGEAPFTTIETLALAAGDAVSLEVFEQQLAESGMGPPHCPRCGFEGKQIKQHDRTLQTRRGLDVPLKRARVLLPRLSPGFFSLGPKHWVWTWTMTTAQRP